MWVCLVWVCVSVRPCSLYSSFPMYLGTGTSVTPQSSEGSTGVPQSSEASTGGNTVAIVVPVLLVLLIIVVVVVVAVVVVLVYRAHRYELALQHDLD